MTAPFTDALLPEVCARVATALVRRQYNRVCGPVCTGVELCQYAIEELPEGGFPIVRTALQGLQSHLIRRGSLADWKRTAVNSSRLGRGFRRCYFDDYKANRR